MGNPNEITIASTTSRGWISTALAARPIFSTRLPTGFKPLASLVHLSDTHVCDSQSPARLAFTDRYADLHFPTEKRLTPPVGNYRPQEMLTSQVLEQMIRTLNQIENGPVFGGKMQFAVITGDLTDNAQLNEFDWLTQLLDGSVLMQTFDQNYLGPGGIYNSEYFWNPEADSDADFPKRLYGFPSIPEFFKSVSQSWKSEGLNLPYVAVHGNHDLLLQGTVRSTPELIELATGSELPLEFIVEAAVHEYEDNFSPFGPTTWPPIMQMKLKPVPAISSRTFISETGFEDRFGLTRKYALHEYDGFTLIQIDTVNPHGGWDGSIDLVQYEWLESELDRTKQPIVIASHHPFNRMNNTYRPSGESERIDGNALVQLLDKYPQVFLWLAGHEHVNLVQKIGSTSQILHIETCSLIDWPQEARILEIAVSDEDFLIASTMISHKSQVALFEYGEKINEISPELGILAGISRELSANDWQKSPLDINQLNFTAASSHRDFLIRIPKRVS